MALLAVAVLLAAGALLLRPGSPPPLQVTGGSVTVDPTTGRCPRAVFELTAVLRTNGSEGTVTAAWRGLDGKTGAPVTLRAEEGRRTISTVLTVTVTGARPLDAAAVLEVRAPQVIRLISPSVRYIC